MLTPAKVKYIIRANTNNNSSKVIAAEMKVSIRTVSRVWSHWVKKKEPWAPKNEDCGQIRMIEEVITDHSSQFFANKTDKNGKLESVFGQFLAKNGIKHILG